MSTTNCTHAAAWVSASLYTYPASWVSASLYTASLYTYPASWVSASLYISSILGVNHSFTNQGLSSWVSPASNRPSACIQQPGGSTSLYTIARCQPPSTHIQQPSLYTHPASWVSASLYTHPAAWCQPPSTSLGVSLPLYTSSSLGVSLSLNTSRSLGVITWDGHVTQSQGMVM